MKFVVTGGAGFVGSHIVDALIERGDRVLILDNLSTGKDKNINPKAEFYEVDIRDYKAVETKLRHVDGIFHCAALARIQPSFSDPESYFQTNAIGTFNILLAAKQRNVKRVIYSASSSAYGDVTLPTSETEKLPSLALHPYGSTKRMGEMLMRDMGTMTKGPETVILRYFNVYGPRQTTDMDGAYPTVIGLFMGLHEKGKPMTIVGDGHQRRDFTWVGEVAQANIAAMLSEKVGNAEIINIGTGKNHSIWDVAKAILDVSPKTSNPSLLSSGKCTIIPSRPGEVRQTMADISEARRLLNFHPLMTLQEGIKRTRAFNQPYRR